MEEGKIATLQSGGDKNGKIDGACDGKNEWDNALRGLVPQYLNMAIVKVGDQNLVDMSELHRQLDDLFKYFNHELSAHNFKNYIRRFMKSKQAQLKKVIKGMGLQHALWVWI
jgi:hypothetical protein